MFKMMLVLAIIVASVTVLACSSGDGDKLAPAAYAAKMEAEAGMVIDVRTPDEYNEGHLKGAENINFYDADFADKIKAKDKDKTYYVYCRSGGRSGKATTLLKEAGFLKVYDMAGGMIAWNAADMPVEK